MTVPGTSTAPVARRRDRAHTGRPAGEAVLVVCTGNICRSAYAERALQGRLDGRARGRVEVGSAGTAPNQALHVPEPLVAAARAVGVTGLERHHPTRLTAGMVTESALVLAASQGHMTAVLREVPRAITRTFTVGEFASVVRQLDARRGPDWVPAGTGVAALAREAARHRALARSAADSIDIPDPYGGPAEGYAAMVRAMEPDLEVIADAIARAVSR